MGGGGHGGFGGMGGGHGGFGGMGGGSGHGGFGGMGGGGHQQFPMWMPRADRRLLMSKQGGGPGRGGVELRPNAVVAKDGSGQFTTITDALAAYKPKKNDNSTRHVIYVKAGVYNEDILVQKKQINLFMYGDGPRKTVITGKKCFRDGVSTFRTAPFSVVGNGFICKSMGFENTAGPEGHQAVALRVQSDMSAFYNCRMDGYQDTLYAHTHRQFYSNCVISGTIDFIFGDAAAVFQDCTIVVRKPMDNQKNIVTAHGRTHFAEPTGLVIQNCQFVAEDGLIAKKAQIKSYLGRPWKPYSRTVIMESTIGDFIDPEGWMPWTGTLGLDTLYYAEYRNRGPAADTSRRVNWKGYHVLRNSKEAMKFTVDPFIQGSEWLPATGAPFFVGLKAANSHEWIRITKVGDQWFQIFRIFIFWGKPENRDGNTSAPFIPESGHSTFDGDGAGAFGLVSHDSRLCLDNPTGYLGLDSIGAQCSPRLLRTSSGRNCGGPLTDREQPETRKETSSRSRRH
nr:pectinesterase-like [Ipomoea batatas]